MVMFNFSNVTGNTTAARFQTVTPTSSFVTSTVVSGAAPIAFTSLLAGQGLPGDTMVFTVSTSNNFYDMRFSDMNDTLRLLGGQTAISTLDATYTMTFNAGSGLNQLSNVSINGGVGIPAVVSYQTTGGNFVRLGAFGSGTANGPITALRFTVSTGNGVAVTSITGTPTCFARGTRIAVPGGVAEVQDLAAGDTVLTHDGETREVLWVGRQSFDLTTGVPEHMRPVRISAGALGGGLPERDLVVTADHALLIGGYLVNASALVDGEAIVFDGPEALGPRLTVYHIETKDHAVILAEGAPAETFIDVVSRAEFDNYAEYEAQCGPDRIIPEAGYPRISARRLLPPELRSSKAA